MKALPATHLIWAAAGQPTTTMGTRNVRPIPLCHRAVPLPCFWCGYAADSGTAIRIDTLSWENFTNWDLARRPDSGWLCGACLFALKDRSLRFQNWVASPAGLDRYERRDPAIRRHLLEPPEPPFAIGVCQPGDSKHMAIRARVNYDRERYWVQYGDEAVWVWRAALRRWAAALAALVQAGARPAALRAARCRGRLPPAGSRASDEAMAVLGQASRSGYSAFDLFLTVFLNGADDDSSQGGTEE